MHSCIQAYKITYTLPKYTLTISWMIHAQHPHTIVGSYKPVHANTQTFAFLRNFSIPPSWMCTPETVSARSRSSDSSYRWRTALHSGPGPRPKLFVNKRPTRLQPLKASSFVTTPLLIRALKHVKHFFPNTSHTRLRKRDRYDLHPQTLLKPNRRKPHLLDVVQLIKEPPRPPIQYSLQICIH